MNDRMIYLKEETREKIVNGALELFTSKGLFDVQMTDIAKHVGISRHTLYRYYQDKADLAISIVKVVLIKVFVDHSKDIYSEVENSSLNGWEKLKHCFYSMWVKKRMENQFRFLAEFDAYYSSTRLSDEMIQKLHENIDPFTTWLWYEIIEEGMKDGSIRDDQDPKLLMVTLVNSARGLNQRIILRGESLIETRNNELKVMMDNFINLIFEGIKGQI